MSYSIQKVGIVDYQAGNILSLLSAMESLGADVAIVRQEREIDGLSHLVLPGVGAFGHCADNLRESGLLPRVSTWALEEGRPILGVCVGMQMMAEFSDELGQQTGLDWVGGHVRKLQRSSSSVRVPHVGWNTTTFHERFGDYHAGDSADFYFDHSYALGAAPRATVLATCEHGERFTAVVRRNNIVAAQFHPEKSQAAGMKFLRGFLDM